MHTRDRDHEYVLKIESKLLSYTFEARAENIMGFLIII